MITKQSEPSDVYGSYLLVKDDGTVHIPGIDYSNRKPMTVAALRGDTIVVFVPSGSCWSGIGQPHVYVPARYMIFKITKVNKKTGRYDVEGCLEFRTRAKNIVTDPVDGGR